MYSAVLPPYLMVFFCILVHYNEYLVQVCCSSSMMWDFRADTHFTLPWLTSPSSVSIWNVHLNFIAAFLSPRSHAHLYIVQRSILQFCYTSIFYLFWVSTTTQSCDFWTKENIWKYVRMDVQLCAFTFSAPPSANPTHPLGRNEATCATALFLLNTNTFQQNTKISTNTFQLLSCLPFYFCTRRHYKPYSNCFVTLLAVPANTQDSAKYRCCDFSNMTFLLFSPPTSKNVTKF